MARTSPSLARASPPEDVSCDLQALSKLVLSRHGEQPQSEAPLTGKALGLETLRLCQRVYGHHPRFDRCHMLPYMGETRLTGYLVSSLIHAVSRRDHSLSALCGGVESGDVCSADGEGPGQATGTGSKSIRKALSMILKRERQQRGSAFVPCGVFSLKRRLLRIWAVL